MTEFGISLQLEKYTTDLILSTVHSVEELGLHAAFVNDHYMKWDENNIPDAYIALAAIAARTRKLRIGTSVTPIPFRHAPHLAKMVATLDNLSHGRFIFGVGAGWNQSEFEGYGLEFLPPAERVSKTMEGITLIKRMWIEDEVTFEGHYYHLKDGILLPKPVQKPHPPILIGSSSPRMRRAVARLGNGWIPFYLAPEQYEEGMRQILTDAKQIGRRRDEFMFVHMTRFVPAKSREQGLRTLTGYPLTREKGLAIGSPRECAEKLQEYVDLGVDLILIRLHRVDNPEEQISFICDKILTRLKD